MEKQSKGMRLLKKGQKGVLRLIFGRTGIVILLLAMNICMLLAVFGWFAEFLPHVYGGTALFILCMVTYLINNAMDPTAKMTWLIVIMLLPIFGSLLYLFTCTDLGHKAMGKRLKRIYALGEPCCNDKVGELEKHSPGAAALARYVSGVTGFPLSGNTTARYFPSGEAALPQMLAELKKAEKSIYLEYFIIGEGEMWGQILEVLAHKAQKGVDVRVMYDGTCEFHTLPKSYPKKLRALGIKCRVFAPVTPFVSTHYNYRDHRKIMTVDGKVAFTGGINLADEYANIIDRYGYWKDNAIMLKGGAAAGFEKMFLQMWCLPDKEPLLPPLVEELGEEQGFVLPYGEDPLGGEQVARQVYIDILNRAVKYVHIMTPYMILDSELISALTYAAKRGVDVQILLPSVSDSKLAHILAKSHFEALIKAGVKLYLYTPGFVHSKVMVADDTEAVVGTVNFDYRSLYHHFECAAYMYGTPAVADIAADFEESVAGSQVVTEETIKNEKLSTKLLGKLLKVIAPLM